VAEKSELSVIRRLRTSAKKRYPYEACRMVMISILPQFMRMEH